MKTVKKIEFNLLNKYIRQVESLKILKKTTSNKYLKSKYAIQIDVCEGIIIDLKIIQSCTNQSKWISDEEVENRVASYSKTLNPEAAYHFKEGIEWMRKQPKTGIKL